MIFFVPIQLIFEKGSYVLVVFNIYLIALRPHIKNKNYNKN